MSNATNRKTKANRPKRALAGIRKRMPCNIHFTNMVVLHNFKVLNMVNEVIIGEDFLAKQGIKITIK